MNPGVVFEIMDLAVTLARAQTGGASGASENIRQDAMLARALLQIIEKAVQAYQEHTGERLDPSLIRPALPIPEELRGSNS